ncbi:MAG: TAXI family TRAP transporter solute-binding subunit [Granulosicoccaceae bacterium]
MYAKNYESRDQTPNTPRQPKKTRSLADTLKIYGGAFLLAAAAFFFAYQFVQPAPPDTLTIATGRTDGAYYAFAQQFKTELAKENIELTILETTGSIENIELLDTSKAQVAFIQSGVVESVNHPEIQGLGSLYFEPVWVFVRKGDGVEQLSQLNGARIAVGQVGSGTRSVADSILADNRLDSTNVSTFELSGMDAVTAFKLGQLDVIFSVGSYNATSVQAMLNEPDAELLNFRRAPAYAKRLPYLSSMILPEGVVDLHSNIPPQDVVLISAAATLVAHTDLHPALNDLLLQISDRLFSQSTLFSEADQFPSAAFVDFPISSEALRFYKSGAPFLQRYLPFWAATLLDRLKVMLVPLLALLIPLFKILPPTYRWTVRKKIYKWYDEIQIIDQSANELATEDNLELCLANLDKIEDEVRTVEVPLGYAHELYVLRQHIDLLARQISAHEQVLERERLGRNAVS